MNTIVLIVIGVVYVVSWYVASVMFTAVMNSRLEAHQGRVPDRYDKDWNQRWAMFLALAWPITALIYLVYIVVIAAGRRIYDSIQGAVPPTRSEREAELRKQARLLTTEKQRLEVENRRLEHELGIQ